MSLLAKIGRGGQSQKKRGEKALYIKTTLMYP